MNVIKLLQVNTQHSYLANHNTLNLAKKFNYNVILLQEPYLNKDERVPQSGYQQVGSGQSVILIQNNIPFAHVINTDNEVSAIQINNTYIYNTYASPNNEIEPILTKLQQHIEQIDKNKTLILGGDFNTGTQLFQSTKQNKRSNQFDRFLAANNLKIHNYEKSTWRNSKKNLESITDYTLTRDIDILGWKILTEHTFSDHYFITYKYETDITIHNNTMYKTTDKKKFETLIENTEPNITEYTTIESLEHNTTQIITWIQNNIDKATIEKKKNNDPPYWNKELQEMKTLLQRLNKQMKKHHRNNTQQQENERLHKKLKKTYKTALKNAKQENWKQLITQTKPWGIPYELFVKQKDNTAIQLPLTSKKETLQRTYKKPRK